MRGFRLISSLAIVSLFVTMYACTLEPENTESSSASPNDMTNEESVGTTSSEVTSGCSHVVFCNKPNSSIGTVCQKDGCTLAEAVSECRSDLTAIGCSLLCPAIVQNSSGTVLAKALSCGGRCCPFGDPNLVYCGPTGACCDGVHFNSACPPL